MMDPKDAGVICPVCGSDDVRRQRYSRRWFGRAMFLFGIPLPVPGRTYFCFACRKDFTIARKDKSNAS